MLRTHSGWHSGETRVLYHIVRRFGALHVARVIAPAPARLPTVRCMTPEGVPLRIFPHRVAVNGTGVVETQVLCACLVGLSTKSDAKEREEI
jgi:hypothetical protein